MYYKNTDQIKELSHYLNCVIQEGVFSFSNVVVVSLSNVSSFFLCVIPGKRYSESLAGSLLPDWIGKSLFTSFICSFLIEYYL